MTNSDTWDQDFYPSYTPKEMLELGVFEGKYINGVKGVPGAWKNLPKVKGPGEKPDETINKFGVKSRQPLSTWKDNGWIKTDPNGWFEWYINYYAGRRLGKEDTWQIGRWRSFVARHMGQIKKGCKLKDFDCRPRQRQGLLQWAWDSTELFDEAAKNKNLKKLGVKITISKENISEDPLFNTW